MFKIFKTEVEHQLYKNIRIARKDAGWWILEYMMNGQQIGPFARYL